MFWKRAAAGESAPTVADTGNHTIAQIAAYSGCITGVTPWDITSVGATSDGPNVVSDPGATTTVANTLIVLVSADAADTTTGQSFVPSNSNLTFGAVRLKSNTNAGAGGGFFVYDAPWASTGNYGVTSYGGGISSGNPYASLTIALKPPSTGITLTAASASYTWTRNAANLLYGRKASPTVTTYALTGIAAALSKGYPLAVTVAAIVLTGTATGLRAAKKLVADVQTYVLSGIAAALKYGRLVAAGTGTYTETGNSANLLKGSKVSVTVGSFSLTGIAATFSRTYRVVAGVAAYVFTGNVSPLLYGRKVAADPATFTLTGISAALRLGLRLLADTGSYTLTGNTAQLLFGRKLTADTGGYTLGGIDVALKTGRRLAANTVAYALMGIDVALSFQGITNLVMSASVGSFALIGSNASPLAARLLTAASATVVFSPAPVGLLLGRSIAPGTGVFALTGNAAVLRAARLLLADTVAYLLTGNPVAILVRKTIDAATVSYILTGNPATLTWQIISDFVLTAATATFSMLGNSAGLRVDRGMVTHSAAYALLTSVVGFTRTYAIQAATAVYALTGTYTAGRLALLRNLRRGRPQRLILQEMDGTMLTLTLLDAQGRALNLTGTTVTLNTKYSLYDEAVHASYAGTVVSASAGKVRFNFVLSDLELTRDMYASVVLDNGSEVWTHSVCQLDVKAGAANA